MLSQLLLGLTTASVASAHFILQYPATAGFDDDVEGTSPCGSAMVMVNSSSPQINVDRFAVSILSTHPQGAWIFRGTTSTEEPYDWSDITPQVNTTGIGTFCLDYMHTPSDWAGKAGVIQVIDDSVDGTLYQCAPVNFISGSNSTLGSSCTNATGFSAMWTTAEASTNSSSSSISSTSSMSSMSGSTASTTMSMPSGSAAATSSGAAAAASASAASAAVVQIGSTLAGVGLLVAGLAL